MSRKVVVTGMGAVTPIGNNVEWILDNAKEWKTRNWLYKIIR